MSTIKRILQNPKKSNFIAILVYLFLLVGFFSYVKYIVNEDLVEIDNKEEDKQVKNIEEVNVYINNPKSLSITNKIPVVEYDYFRYRISNAQNVSYLFEKLRDEKLLSFEITRYINDNEFNHINDLTPPEGYEWEIYVDGQNITNSIKDLDIISNTVFDIKLTPQNSPTHGEEQ